MRQIQYINITVDVVGQENCCSKGRYIHLLVHIKIKNSLNTIQKFNGKITRSGKNRFR